MNNMIARYVTTKPKNWPRSQTTVLVATLSRWVIGLMIVLPMMLITAVLLQPFAEPKWMFLDPLAAAEMAPQCCHVYYGLISNVGLIMWFATAAICLAVGLAFLVTYKPSPFTKFALSAGLLSGWIGLDDMFLVHEKVMPKLGIAQELVILLYLGLAVVYFASSWRFILAQRWWILGLSAFALGGSIFVDQVFHSVEPKAVYIEDSAKFFGIVYWSTFHVLTVFEHLCTELSKQKTRASS